MNTLTISGIIGAFGSIITIIIWVACHTANRDRHPAADKVVYVDTCRARISTAESERKRIEDCLEGAVNSLEKKVDEHHAYNKEQFAEIKSLIKKNGKS